MRAVFHALTPGTLRRVRGPDMRLAIKNENLRLPRLCCAPETATPIRRGCNNMGCGFEPKGPRFRSKAEDCVAGHSAPRQETPPLPAPAENRIERLGGQWRRQSCARRN